MPLQCSFSLSLSLSLQLYRAILGEFFKFFPFPFDLGWVFGPLGKWNNSPERFLMGIEPTCWILQGGSSCKTLSPTEPNGGSWDKNPGNKHQQSPTVLKFATETACKASYSPQLPNWTLPGGSELIFGGGFLSGDDSYLLSTVKIRNL